MKEYSYNSYRINNSGFTLIETLVTAVIIGIIAAIAAPNLLGLFSHNRVKEAIATINGAIKETQRQAIRQGKQCEVKINKTTNIISGDPTDCLLKQREINDSIEIRATNSLGNPEASISFSAKGTTASIGTIVVSSNNTDTQKCFVISLGLGITRTGEYTGAKTGSVSADNCETE